MSSLNMELMDNGYAVVPKLIDIDEVDRIGRFVMDTLAATAGTRRLIELPWCRDPGGVIAIDFLAAKTIDGRVSRTLGSAIAKYRAALPDLCAKHGASLDDFKTLTARYSGYGLSRRVVVTVRDRLGRSFVDEYVGVP